MKEYRETPYPGCLVALTVVGLAFTSILAGRWWALVGGAGCVLLVSGVVAYLLEKTNGRPIFPKARPQEATLPSSMDALKEIPADPKGADLASPKKTFTRQESERQTTIRLVNGPHERGCYGCLTLFALYACIGPFVAQTDFVKSHGSPDLITVVLLALVAAGFSHWFLQWRRMPRPGPGRTRFPRHPLRRSADWYPVPRLDACDYAALHMQHG